MDWEDGEEIEDGRDLIVEDEWGAGVDWSGFEIGIGGLKGGKNEKDGLGIIRIIDRCGMEEIGDWWSWWGNGWKGWMELMMGGEI